MIFRSTEDWENILNRASNIDDRLNYQWMELLDDDEYQTLAQIFDRDNFPHEDPFDEDNVIRPDTKKIIKQLLVGKDRIDLILYAFMLGQFVGQAAIIVRDNGG